MLSKYCVILEINIVFFTNHPDFIKWLEYRSNSDGTNRRNRTLSKEYGSIVHPCRKVDLF